MESVLVALGLPGYVWLGLTAVSWALTGVVVAKLRATRRELRDARSRGDVRRWIRSGGVRSAAADVLEKHGLLALMTPRMTNDLYVSLEESLIEEMEMGGSYTEWDRLCDEGSWGKAAAGKGARKG